MPPRAHSHVLPDASPQRTRTYFQTPPRSTGCSTRCRLSRHMVEKQGPPGREPGWEPDYEPDADCGQGPLNWEPRWEPRWEAGWYPDWEPDSGT
eukprot:362884-Chlamydomonas_euryale.AAC.2